MERFKEKIWCEENTEKYGNRINFRKRNLSYHFWKVNHPFCEEIRSKLLIAHEVKITNTYFNFSVKSLNSFPKKDAKALPVNKVSRLKIRAKSSWKLKWSCLSLFESGQKAVYYIIHAPWSNSSVCQNFTLYHTNGYHGRGENTHYYTVNTQGSKCIQVC